MNIPRQGPKRTGFTLIELLVVMGIIAVLTGLTAAGVVRFLRVQTEKQTMRELLGLSEAADKFKGEIGIYPPSKMVLCKDRSGYGAAPLDQQSLAVLDKMFPTLGNFSGVNWNGASTAAREVLDGDQCLVFFLGGINRKGFAKVGKPDSGAEQRFGPYYEFPPKRLVARSGKTFPSFLDPYSNANVPGESSPYAFFSTGLSKRYTPGIPLTTAHSHLGIAEAYKKAGTPSKWLNPESVQIISAGRDNQFGPGGLWSAATADLATADDQSNFHGGFLASGGN